MKKPLLAVQCASIVSCATLTEDAMTPVAFSFSDGAEGKCKLSNKRGYWETPIASAVFLDLGITDAITDKHRQYPASFVIPLAKVGSVAAEPAVATPATEESAKL